MTEDRLPAEALARLQYEATAKVRIGKPYRHKKSGDRYMPLSVALEEATLTPVVYYVPTADVPLGMSLAWTRPVDEFLEKFEPELGR